MTQLTIGQLARRTGISRSALRFYEAQGLLMPVGRTAAGYRIYADEAVDTVTFVQRAQRLGFSLRDIGSMLARQPAAENQAEFTRLAENRYLQIERQLTELLVQRHEMGVFLNEIRAAKGDPYQRLVERVCGHDHAAGGAAAATLNWLLVRTGCQLADSNLEAVIAPLLGRHMHIWRDGDEYRILVPGHDAAAQAALKALAAVEAQCHAHATPRLERSDEGFLFIASGENAFLFAQLFLDIESAKITAPA